MRKEENRKVSLIYKQELESRQSLVSPKVYSGCGTCKMKNSDTKKDKSTNKLSCLNVTDKNKLVIVEEVKEKERDIHKSKVKLTDLCDEDKKRIVDLIEELSRFAEKNQQLKLTISYLQKTRKEQQEYIMQQARTHLEETTCFMDEINEYKNKVKETEKELQEKISNWENQEKYVDAEMALLVNLLQKSIKERNEMNQQIQELKICLRQSLETFQSMRSEVRELQRLEQIIGNSKTVSCQTDTKSKMTEEDSEADEYLSTCNQETFKTRSSLDVINEKLENVYQLLKKRSESLLKNFPQKLDIDLSILLKSENEVKEKTSETHSASTKEDAVDELEEFKFLKPFDQYSKTSLKAERILKKMGKPLNLTVNECVPKLENNKEINCKTQKSSQDVESFTKNVLQNKIVQKNNLFKSSEENQFDEDRLLDELFYSQQSLNFDFEGPNRSAANYANKVINFTGRDRWSLRKESLSDERMNSWQKMGSVHKFPSGRLIRKLPRR